ncbi:MAG: CBS domain-containing protein [Chloroflexi bacterium]|nr:CBS domain-containing protein [Chloroflexota bacterium]
MNAIPIARILGFEIRVHVSWAIILAIVAVTVSSEVGRTAPATTELVRWLIGAGIAASFLLSALAHELGHAIAARRAGLPGGPVVLYFFGGAATPSLVATRARDEVVVALAGPAVSLAVGGVLLLVTGVGELVGSGPVQVLGRLALIVSGLNLLLGLVNLLPAYPLDGGRAVRGLVWSRTGDATRGVHLAARIGRLLGLAFATIGLVGILVVDSFDGLLLVLAGWFLVGSARSVERIAAVDVLLEGILVADVMDHDVPGVPPGLTVDTFAGQLLDGTTPASVPVLAGNALLGLVGARQVRRLRRARWAGTRAEDLMISGDALPRVAPSTTLRAVLEQLHRSGLDGLPVLDDGRFTGIVTQRAVAKVLRDRAQTRGAIP